MSQSGTAATLMDRMVDTLGLDLDELTLRGVLDTDEIVRARQRCQGCRAPGACHLWLDAHESAEAAPDFCRNAPLFTELK